MSLVKVSLVLLLGGLVWLGDQYFTNRLYPNRTMPPPAEAQLSTVTGKITNINITEQKTKKGVLFSRYIDVDIQSPQGTVTVRIKEPNLGRSLEGFESEIVTAKFDAKDDNMVFSLGTTARQAITYRETADWRAALAESNKGGYLFGWIAVALGMGGCGWGEKRLKLDWSALKGLKVPIYRFLCLRK
ncbi:hypothetical protein AAKU64_003827 [Undibacterium sp. GrIS 1.8]|uniref:hypothetical protein n=1 Tax=Undibacterium sp. GrIS 1.8 TaxID=3143934 RepID=UPI0033943995